MKKCSHCQIVKDDSEFHKNRSTPTGLQHLCKVCELEAQRKTYKEHPDTWSRITRNQRLSGCRKKYNELHKEETAEYMTQYHLEHRHNWKAYRQKRRARIKFNGGEFTGKEWKELCGRYRNVCLCCKQPEKLVPDHILPLSKGGSNSIENIQPLCQPCNRKKHTQIIDYR